METRNGEHRTMNNSHTIVKQWSLNSMLTFNNCITMNDNCITMNDNCMTMNDNCMTMNDNCMLINPKL